MSPFTEHRDWILESDPTVPASPGQLVLALYRHDFTWYAGDIVALGHRSRLVVLEMLEAFAETGEATEGFMELVAGLLDQRCRELDTAISEVIHNLRQLEAQLELARESSTLGHLRQDVALTNEELIDLQAQRAFLEE